MQLTIAQKIIFGILAVLIIFWLLLTLTHTTFGFYSYLYSFLMCVIPLYGGIIAILSAERWQGMNGNIGKGMLFLGLGLVCWGAGELVWSYYNFFVGVAAPYPSLADVGFVPSTFFYCAGVVYLLRAAGADAGLGQRFAKAFIVVASIAMLALSYYLLVIVAKRGELITRGDPFLKSLLDIAYPVGDFISLTVAVVLSGLSFKYLTREYRTGVMMLLFGLATMFAADLVFSYTTTRMTYFNGDLGDLIFTIGTFLLSFGVLAFAAPSHREKNT
jgi:hypothetical protein